MLGTQQEGFNGLGQHLVTMPEDTTMKQKSQSKTEKYVVDITISLRVGKWCLESMWLP